MRIKVTKDDKQHKFTIKNWSDVTLETWVKLIQSENKGEIEKSQDMINLMTDMPKELINQLTLEDVTKVLRVIAKLQTSKNSKFKQVIKVGNDQYGFIPDLERITLGEYADIEHYIKGGIEKNMPNIVAILYRPITQTEGKYYSIEAYDSSTMRLRARKFLEMKAQEVQQALVFFWIFASELLKILQLYLTDKLKKARQQLMNNSQRSGVGLA